VCIEAKDPNRTKSLVVEALKASLAETLDEVEVLVLKGDEGPTPSATIVGERGAVVPFFR
jgi:hypothetical protein